MIIPYSTEVLIKKWPLGNLAIIGVCVIAFALLLSGSVSLYTIEGLILTGWNPVRLIGHQFIHAGLLHLGFNMLYLWVFGNAVCEKIGNLAFLAVFLICGAAAACVHNIMDGNPAVGASGAINGIVGIYIVLYPINRINCLYWFIRPGTFDISGFWLIIFWFIIDAWNAFSGAETGIAYWAHVGGFISGIGIGVLLLKTGIAKMSPYDNPTLLDYIGKKTTVSQPQRQSVTRAGSISAPFPKIEARPVPAAKPVPVQIAQDINIDCPHCSQNLDIPPAMIGRSFCCPTCSGAIELSE